MTSPVVDLSSFKNGTNLERLKLANELLDSLSQRGFVKIIGHGIQNSTVAKLFEWNKTFFRMSASDKLSIAHPGGSEPQRGCMYFPASKFVSPYPLVWYKEQLFEKYINQDFGGSAVGMESSSSLYRKGLLKSQMNDNLKDAREHFDQGATGDHQYPNRWPDVRALPGFREFMEHAFEILEDVASQILEALEMALNLPCGAFLNNITRQGNASEMRLNHYPAIDIGDIRRGGVSRIWPHFDLGVITLLFQDGVGGLEFENRKQPGTFTRVECGGPSEMVVNVSETLQRWTNGSLPAGLHRVNLPQDMEDKESGLLPERYSVAYFCKADRGASVGPLKQFVREGSKPAYEEISAIEYHLQRLQSAY